MLFRYMGVLLTLLVVWSPAQAQGEKLPRFEPAACAFDVPAGQNPECGKVIVPEDWTQPDNGRTIQLAVAVFKSTQPERAAEPVIYLEGGPGGSALEYLSQSFNTTLAPFLDRHDVIVFDQRGIGKSQPSLECSEIADFTYATLDQQLTTDEYVQQFADALIACGERLQRNGFSLSAYTTVQNAADVAAIGEALGYGRMNLFGTSYGTKLALGVMRDHPASVRSVILDSVYPNQVSQFDAAANAQRAFNTLFAGCRANAACNEAYPELEDVFYGLIDRLNAAPVEVQAVDIISGRSRAALIDGDTFAGLVFQALYSSDLIPTLPQQIYAVRDGDYRLLTGMMTAQLVVLDAISWGMYEAVNCNEDFAFDTETGARQALANLRPELVGFARRAMIDVAQLSVCRAWTQAGPDPRENEAVTSDIPTLVVSGEYDPVTPPAYGQMAAETLSRSFFYTFPGKGHGVVSSAVCAREMARAFLQNPKQAPDSGCLSEMTGPDFTVTGKTAAAVIELEPFSAPNGTYTTVRPMAWTEAQPGVFARAANPLDQTALVIQSVPGGGLIDPAQMAAMMAQQFGSTAEPEDNGTRQANGLTWSLFRVTSDLAEIDIATAKDGGLLYLMLLASNREDRDALVEAVLLPAIDAFTLTK